MAQVVGRIVAVSLTAGGWEITGIRAVLDLIGYSTIPEDKQVATGLLRDFLIWILQLPWWVPWGFALIATVTLIWVSWPRTLVQAGPQESKLETSVAPEIAQEPERTVSFDESSQQNLLKELKKYSGTHYNADIEFANVAQRPLADTLASIFQLAQWKTNYKTAPQENRAPHDFWPDVHVWGYNKHLIETVARAMKDAGIPKVRSSVFATTLSADSPKRPAVDHRVKVRIGHVKV